MSTPWSGSRAARSRRPVRLAASGLAALVVLALAACTSIPTSGAVREGDGTVTENGDIDVLAEGPRPGATPQQIVEGFQLAGAAGFDSEFATAREFLTGPVKRTWEPLTEVLVAEAPVVVDTRSRSVTATVPLAARVDADGRYTEAPQGADTAVTYDLVRVQGEWRISLAPDGLVLSAASFDKQFRSTPLYFLSADGESLVPDTRWFPAHNLQTWVARALLVGPSPWLRDAVTTAIPEGVQLQAGTVVIDVSGSALVPLDPANTLLKADTASIVAQFEASLIQVAGVRRVKVTAGAVPLVEQREIPRGGLPDGPVEMIQDDQLVALGEDGLTAVDGIAPLPAGSRALARDEKGDLRVMLDAGGSLVTVPRVDAESRVLVPGPALVAPSVDRLGWVWTARAGEGVIAVKDGEDPLVVPAEWLEGRTTVAVRMARDATRLAVVSRGADGVWVNVFPVVRDAQGTPQKLGEPVRVGAVLEDATEVVWLDESVLGVVGRSDGETLLVHRVPVFGPTTAEPEVPDVEALAGGRVVYLTTTDGVLHKLVGTTWATVADVEGVRDPSYPG
ncbi:MAG: LpqB family beta-propeller domain-containing protein [Cellulomonas sp.]|uniref:LpqB family beta-propeller domain-containing protein n=1 Tax=Cellulomonas sp. A375-1 TaxID=1672219 RepID=UPI00065265EF|nr:MULTISPECIES: LpqB family beta-propeller domain-containing protein [unclassified Cellulomonas]KMM47272.1 lipoprotein [Cellulomonas sp. A375-1]MCR6647983.1 LpqB family beta-propeller domain-containing protein [Cellulomonas sp.]